LRGKKIASGSLRLGDGEFKTTRISNGDANGRVENLEKQAWSKKMREKSNPHLLPKAQRDAAPKSLTALRPLRLPAPMVFERIERSRARVPRIMPPS